MKRVTRYSCCCCSFDLFVALWVFKLSLTTFPHENIKMTCNSEYIFCLFLMGQIWSNFLPLFQFWEQNPEIYGIRRSSRARKEPERLTIKQKVTFPLPVFNFISHVHICWFIMTQVIWKWFFHQELSDSDSDHRNRWKRKKKKNKRSRLSSGYPLINLINFDLLLSEKIMLKCLIDGLNEWEKDWMNKWISNSFNDLID